MIFQIIFLNPKSFVEIPKQPWDFEKKKKKKSVRLAHLSLVYSFLFILRNDVGVDAQPDDLSVIGISILRRSYPDNREI